MKKSRFSNRTFLSTLVIFLLMVSIPDFIEIEIRYSQGEISGEEEKIVIRTPDFIPVRSPFMVFISLNISEEVRLKASLNSMQGKYATKLWNGTEWVYPGGGWSMMPMVSGNFTGFLYLKPQYTYSGWRGLHNSETAYLNVSVKDMNTSQIIKGSIEVRLLDYDDSPAIQGFTVSGKVFHDNSLVEGGFVTLGSGDLEAGNASFRNLTSFYTTESNGISEDHTGKGSYELWSPPGNFTLVVYSDIDMRELLYSMNLTISYNLTINLGNYTIPCGVCINEVLYDPQGNEMEGEFIELFNFLDISVDLTGWTLSDQDGDVDFIFPHFSLDPHSFVVLHTGIDEDCFVDGIWHFYLGKSSSYLTNTGDDLLLTAQDGTHVDYVSWGDGSSVDPPPHGVPWEGNIEAAEGLSLSLIPDGADINTSKNWEEAPPTPGYSNVPEEKNMYTPFVSPDNSMAAIVSAIENSEREIQLELYSVSNPVLIQEINQAIDRGVKVRALLQKDHPIPIFDNYTLFAAVDWSQHGAEVRAAGKFPQNISQNIPQDTPQNVSQNNYMIVDGEKALCMTSNWSMLTAPGEVSFGKRIWGLSFRNKTIVELLSSRFLENWNTSSQFPLTGNGTSPGLFPGGDYPAPFQELRTYSNGSVEILSLPDDVDRVLSLLEKAESTIYLQADHIPFTNSTGPNQVVEILASKAREGKDIRIVLSDGQVRQDNRSAEYLHNAGARVYLNNEFGVNNDLGAMDGSLLIVDNIVILLADISGYPILIPGLADNTTFTPYSSDDHNFYSHSFALLIQGACVERYLEFFLRDIGTSQEFGRIFSPYHPMIIEVYYNTYGGGNEEYLVLFNQGNESVNLSGWMLTDGEGTYILPDLTFTPGEKAYMTRNPEVFLHLTSISTDLTFPLSLGNEKDSLSLLDPLGHTVDAVAWGGGRVPGGWEGDLSKVGKGQVIRRNRASSLYADTDSSEDWENHRIFMVGQSDFPFTILNFTGEVTTFVSPDSSFQAIHRELENASESIYLNVYQITNLYLMEDLLRASNRSVEVKVLIEGGPVGGIPDTELYIAHRLSEADIEVNFIHNNDTVKDRFNYDHAKYAVIDHDTLILDSENWKSSGIPVDPSYGNRGWGIIVRNREVAKYFEMVFAYDSDPIFYDVVEFGRDRYLPPENFTHDYSIPLGSYRPRYPATSISGEFEITPVIAPDHTLRKDAIIGMIDRAEKSVYIEQLQCHISWTESISNLFLEAAIKAAERGCDVRVLLDCRYVNTKDDKQDNADTVGYINDIALQRGLDNLRARLAVLKGLSKVHNKGVIVDCEYTLISSINWGKGAALLNREAGVIVRNEEVAEYYTEVFLDDWSMTGSGEGEDGEGDDMSSSYYVSAVVIVGGVIAGILIRRRK